MTEEKAKEKICFVIAPIGEQESEIRKRSDKIFKHVIAPVATECGYNPIRADYLSDPGMITSQILEHIMDDELIIADLTGHNPNVFYELAVAHAIKNKALVQIIEDGEQIPFDIAGTRTIYIDHTDLNSVADAKDEMIKQIEALENATSIDTPISMTLDLQKIRQSEDPETLSMADLFSNISDLRAYLIRIEKAIHEYDRIFPQGEKIKIDHYSDYSDLKTILTIRSKNQMKMLINELEIELENLSKSESINKETDEYYNLQKIINKLKMLDEDDLK